MHKGGHHHAVRALTPRPDGWERVSTNNPALSNAARGQRRAGRFGDGGVGEIGACEIDIVVVEMDDTGGTGGAEVGGDEVVGGRGLA